MTRQELRVELNAWMCGCGSPEGCVRFIYDVLCMFRTRWNQDRPLSLFKPEDRPSLERVWAEYSIAKKALLPTDGIEYFVLYMLTHWDWIEHGGSVGGSWMTQKGEAILAALDAEVSDEFAAFCGDCCIHGYDDTDTEHDCAAMP
jgi:hypothetical protein